jgi:transposase
VLLYEDETHVRAYQSLHATWSEVGKQKQVPTYGHHASVTLFGAVNAVTGDLVHQTAPACKQENFLSFLKQVVKHYPSKTIAMVVDNARIHRAKGIKDFLKEEDRVVLIPLPPYSPNLNPIEKLWKWLKQTVIANQFHPTRSSIEESMNQFLEEISRMPKLVLSRLGIH